MKNPNIVIVDYEAGNTFSVFNAIFTLGYNKVKISHHEEVIRKADVLILPGVGAFDTCSNNLRSRYLDKILEEEVFTNSKPILGICVGMQLLASYSEENGIHQGLGWIEGSVKKIDIDTNILSVPHVGWNEVNYKLKDPIFEKNEDNAHFYFDHSYHFQCDSEFVAATCDYGISIIAAVQKNNIYGVQFHPEKSQNSGLKLFRSFLNSV